MNDQSNPFRMPFIGIERYLEVYSRNNFDDYCLSFVLTNRDFDDGVLGLAWVGAAKGIYGRGWANLFKERAACGKP